MTKNTTKRDFPTARHGFTLIEIIFYFAIIGFILLAAMTFAIQVTNLSKQSENIDELQASIDFVSQQITIKSQEALSINDAGSTFDNDIGALSLNVPATENSPTTFYLQNEEIYIQEGSASPVKITSDSIKCTQLRFQKISYPKAADQIIIDATFEPVGTDIANLQHTLSFHTSVSLRQHD